MSQDQIQERARLYARLSYAVAVVSFGLGVVYLAFMIIAGSDWLYRLVRLVGAARFWVVGLYAAGFSLGYTALAMPLRVYRGFVVERYYGLSRQSFPRWLADETKRVALSTLMVMALAEIVYALLHWQPQYWWIWAGAIWFVLGVVLSRLAPVLLIPLFYKQTPLRDEDLRRRIEELLSGTGFSFGGLYVFNLSRTTRKATAFLTGLGRSRRVLLADTLLVNLTPEEIVAVVGHELGHHVYGHIWKLLVANGMLSFLAFYAAYWVLGLFSLVLGYSGVDDVRTLPLLVGTSAAVAMLVMPLQSLISRTFESHCDLYAGRRTGHPEHLVGGLEKLAGLNLIQRRPPRLIHVLFHDHPSIEERVRRLQHLARQLQSGT